MLQYLKKKYDKNDIQLCNKLIFTQCKIIIRDLLLEFLKQCMIKTVIPKWILFRINNSKLKLSSKVEKKL